MEKILKLILDKIDSLDQKVSTLDQKVSTVDEKISAMDQKVSAMDQKISAMDQKVSVLDQKVSVMDQKVNAMDQRITDMDQRIIGMDQRLTAEQKRQGDLLHQLINTVEATNIKIFENNERMDAIETKVDILVQDGKEIKNSMVTKYDLEFYDQKISEHSREIYKLKNN
jgi:chromosome segregation ATPase